MNPAWQWQMPHVAAIIGREGSPRRISRNMEGGRAVKFEPREAGKPVTSVPYLICLTNECDGEVRTRKIRALIVRRELLLNLPTEAPKLESPNHRVRWETLMQLAGEFQKDPWKFLEIEIVS